MWKFISYEIRYWLKTPMIWIFLLINTLLVFGAVASENVQIGGSIGNIHKNAPYVVETFYATMSIISLLMTTAFMNATANRDFQYGMYQFVFTSPIQKRHYFFGKFIGAALVSFLPLLGVSLGVILGSFLGPLFDWVPAERFGETIWAGHIQGIIIFAIPNVIISGVLLFGLAIIFRSAIVSFIGSMLILVLYVISSGFTDDIQKEWIANLLDPFGDRPFEIMTKYLTVVEKNSNAITLHGDLLVNRIIWLSISVAILMAIYSRFSFSMRNIKIGKQKKEKIVAIPLLSNHVIHTPKKAGAFSCTTFLRITIFEIKSVVKNPSFIIITAIGMINLVIGLSSFTGRYGVAQYPVTYSVVDTIENAFNIFMIGFITFYTGVLVWKERDSKFNEIQDATPIRTTTLFFTKLIAIIVAIAIVLLCTILFGIASQTIMGYYNYELDVYLKGLLLYRLSGLSFLVVLSLLFHYLINNRYVAYFAFSAFIIINSFIWNVLEINSNMISFAARPSVTYSDMNGFGPFVPGLLGFTTYWTLFCAFLCIICLIFYIRGKDLSAANRLRMAKQNVSSNRVSLLLSFIAFLICGGFVYYNTEVLNTYDRPNELEKKQVAYEKQYKKYENRPQPRFYKFNYTIDIMPYERSVVAKVESWAKNKTTAPITELYITMPEISDSIDIQIPGSTLKVNDKELYFRIYKLTKPLAPNDSILIQTKLWKYSKGFENEVSFTSLTHNGTFFNSSDLLPQFGYQRNIEITDKNKRVKLKLPPRERSAKLDPNNLAARSNTYISNDSDWVEVNTTISTSADQTAIAPGTLLKAWTANNRNYFQYRLDQKSLNFYYFISARYTVERQKWNGIDLEVYYDKQHAYNVPNMINSMKKSLDYYTKNFGPYFHKQCRVIEFPRYSSFAQAFPGTMPFSEGIGFIVDLRDVTKDDIDQVFYVVAHEMAHQYWAHQVCGADMQGSEMMSEGFSQYAALMVMEKEYGKDKMKKFLKYEMDEYLSGRSLELEGENPLMKTENQQYIHYNKASVVMYYLKEMIGEKKVNEALRAIVEKFSYQEPPYATTVDAVEAFRKVTPDSLQYLIDDLFENITLFSNRALKATYKKTGSDYEVTLTTTSEKFRCDALGKETKMPIADYIDIGVFAKSDNDQNLGKVLVYKRVKITKKDNVFTFKTKELPDQVGIDPYNYLIDRIPDDNLKKVEKVD